MRHHSLSLLIPPLIFLIFSLSVAPLEAASIRAELKGSYFSPSDRAFKDIYGQGPTYGAEAGLKLGRFLGFWVGVESFTKKGQMTFTREETTLKIMPLAAGLSGEFPLGPISPYVKLGLGYFHYEENNVLGTVKKSNVGYLGQVGLIARIIGPLFLDLFGSYSVCQVKPLELEADLGGFKAGLGLGLQF